MNHETPLFRKCQLVASKLGWRLFRNLVAGVWLGKGRHLPNGDVVVSHARHVSAGLAPGSSDGVGYLPVTITEAHIGQRIAVFLTVETKGTTRTAVRDGQSSWLTQVASDGGISVLAYDTAILEEMARNAADGAPVWGRIWGVSKQGRRLDKRDGAA